MGVFINLIANWPDPEIVILDSGFALGNSLGQKNNLKIVQDHINLTTLNPFIGHIPPKFFAVNNLYKTNIFPELEPVIIVGLNPNSRPSLEQSKILLKASANYYSFNLVLTALVAAFHNKNVIGLIQET